MNKRWIMGLIVIFLPLALASGEEARTGREGEGMHELVHEVRMLRQAIETYAKRQAQFDLLLQRCRFQHEIISLMSVRLEDTRTELANLLAGIPRTQDQAQTVETQARQASDPDRRAELEAAFKDLQATLRQQKQRESELRDREARLATAMQTEEGRLDLLNQKLENGLAALSASPEK